jgi:hypothetical protein
MKDAYYFPHDSNARNDPKMSALKLKYRAFGVGMYWIFIEILRDQEEFKYFIDQDIVWDNLADEFMTTPKKAEEFINDCIHKFKLLKTDGQHIWSDSLIRRLKPMLEERDKKSAGGKKGMQSRWGNKSSENNLVITELYDTSKNDITPDNKGKESKVKESKGEDSKSLKIFSPESWEYKFASALKQLILKNNPTAKTPDDLQKWAKGFDMIFRVDNRNIDEVSEVLRYCQQDKFWMKNILSPDNFRKHYDRLKMLWEEWTTKV